MDSIRATLPCLYSEGREKPLLISRHLRGCCFEQSRRSWHRPHDTLEVLRSKVLKIKLVAEELAGTFGNHDAVRRLRPASARELRRLALAAARERGAALGIPTL
jgi:hypothetical protein